MRNQKGFTLVELLVVIAIIGILSTVAVVNLNSARDKAKVAAVQGNLSAVIPAIILCHNEGNNIQNGAGTPADCSGAAWTAGGTLCADPSANWPILGSNGTAGTCTDDPDAGTFTITATASDSDSTTITCDDTGCTSS